MTRTSTVASAAMALTLTLVVGCDKAAGEQQKANAAQAEADRKIAEANKEATTKTTSAQLEADKNIAAAESDFAKRREDYRHKLQSDLVGLDKKIELLEAKSKTATGKTRTNLDVNLAHIRARRGDLSADLRSVETATAVQWDSTKARVDKDLSDLAALVDMGS
jgi:chromosome segregation ATPase